MGSPIAMPGRRADALTLGLILVVVGLYVLTSTFVGAPAIGLVALAVGAIVVVQRPGLALALVIAPTVLIEDSRDGGFLPGLAGFYDGVTVSPFEALLALAVMATVLDVVRRRELRLPDPLTLPLLLVAVAALVGMFVGVANGASLRDVTFAARPMLPLLLLPVVMINVLRDRNSIRRALFAAALLVGIKAGLGLVSVVVGQGYVNPGDPPITYLEPAINWLSVAVLLVLVARLVQRDRPPLWLLAIALLSTASVVLSYRRSFWIAAVAGLLIVVMFGFPRRRLLILIPCLSIVMFALWLTVETNSVGELQGPIVERATSLNPSSLQGDAQDRYRIGERRNVIAEIEQHPASGLGLAVPWVARYPLSLDRPGSRFYVHFTALWWWLKLGFLGLIAYLAVMGSSIWASYRVWREHRDPWFQAIGLAMVGALIGLALAETTAAFTGVTPRLTAVFAATVGVIVAMLADARQNPPALRA